MCHDSRLNFLTHFLVQKAKYGIISYSFPLFDKMSTHVTNIHEYTDKTGNIIWEKDMELPVIFWKVGKNKCSNTKVA